MWGRRKLPPPATPTRFATASKRFRQIAARTDGPVKSFTTLNPWRWAILRSLQVGRGPELPPLISGWNIAPVTYLSSGHPVIGAPFHPKCNWWIWGSFKKAHRLQKSQPHHDVGVDSFSNGGHDMAQTPKNAACLGGKSLKMTIHDLYFFWIPVIQVRVFATLVFPRDFRTINQYYWVLAQLLGISHLGVTPGQFGTILALEVQIKYRKKKNCRNDDDQIIQSFIGLPRSVRIFSANVWLLQPLDLLNGLTLWNHPTPSPQITRSSTLYILNRLILATGDRDRQG